MLASTLFPENQDFQTTAIPPFLKKIKNHEYTLILDLDETLVHFKIVSL